MLSASQASGTAPVTVNFASTGSSDADGSIAAYEWNFGDGSAVATTPSASHTYTAPGSYTATLKVTDNSGLSAAQSTTITVQQPQPTITVRMPEPQVNVQMPQPRVEVNVPQPQVSVLPAEREPSVEPCADRIRS